MPGRPSRRPSGLPPPPSRAPGRTAPSLQLPAALPRAPSPANPAHDHGGGLGPAPTGTAGRARRMRPGARRTAAHQSGNCSRRSPQNIRAHPSAAAAAAAAAL
eukprot:6939073-Alexandrium_andersonii.AAC.1